jgi:hypothetical protein
LEFGEQASQHSDRGVEPVFAAAVIESGEITITPSEATNQHTSSITIFIEPQLTKIAEI